MYYDQKCGNKRANFTHVIDVFDMCVGVNNNLQCFLSDQASGKVVLPRQQKQLLLRDILIRRTRIVEARKDMNVYLNKRKKGKLSARRYLFK